MAPYATTVQRFDADPTSVLFLAADVCALSESRLVLRDPRYPLEVDLDDEVELDLVRRLMALKFVELAQLKSEVSPCITPGEFDRALMRLMRMGIVVASHADNTLEVSNDSLRPGSVETDSDHAA